MQTINLEINSSQKPLKTYLPFGLVWLRHALPRQPQYRRGRPVLAWFYSIATVQEYWGPGFYRPPPSISYLCCCPCTLRPIPEAWRLCLLLFEHKYWHRVGRKVKQKSIYSILCSNIQSRMSYATVTVNQILKAQYKIWRKQMYKYLTKMFLKMNVLILVLFVILSFFNDVSVSRFVF